MDPAYTIRQLCDVCAGDHICYLCSNDEEKWQVLGEFYQKGHERKEKMLFVYERCSPEELMERFEEKWIKDIRACIKREQFQLMHFSELYIKEGAFEPTKMINMLCQQTEQALAEGYTGLRITGEMSWASGEANIMQKLIEYEALLNHFYPEQLTAGLCMYDTRVFSPGVLLQVLSTHPDSIIKGKLFHNIYYMPPEDFLGPDLDRAILNRWMNNIQERQNVEQQLLAAKLDAERLVHAKSIFLATMSHEIRNPTNGIIGSADLLNHTHTTAEQEEYVNIIQSSAKHLYKVVSDVLDFAKFESDTVRLSVGYLEIHTLMQESINLCQYSAQKNLSVRLRYVISPECPPVIIGDETRLRQILVNLIGNACKFTEEGEIVVSVTPVHLPMPSAHVCSVEGGENSEKLFLEFAVADTGTGISLDDQAKLFQKFTQLDVSRKWAGTGLGLAICKQFADAMGGQIFVKSAKGKGSTFYFRIPVSNSPPSSLSRPSSSPSRSSCSLLSTTSCSPLYSPSSPIKALPIAPPSPTTTPIPLSSSSMLPNPLPQQFSYNNVLYDFSEEHILVVEDNKTNQKILKRMLEKTQCKVDVASNGLQGIEMASNKDYSLIFMDQYMPECDGVTATRRIREDRARRGKKCPKVVGFTGTYEDRLKDNMDEVLLKPVRFETLLDVVTKYCTNKMPPN